MGGGGGRSERSGVFLPVPVARLPLRLDPVPRLLSPSSSSSLSPSSTEGLLDRSPLSELLLPTGVSPSECSSSSGSHCSGFGSLKK